MMNTVELMRLFMEPRSVALVGLTRSTGLVSYNTLENLLGYGFAGQLYPVNPAADEILGIKCYPSVKEIPGDIDLAVILTPRSVVPQLVKECTERGIKAITVVGQGFADGDEKGKKLQEEIVRIARGSGARVIGPNTFGTANAFVNFNSAFVRMDMKKVPIGVICQTGLFFGGLPGFPILGKGIDLGNACDIDFSDGLEYFEDDPDVRVILLYIEGLKDGKRFMEVARRVAQKKPIIALKSGQSEGAARAAQSHSGSLAGQDEVYDAAFKQCGVIRVTSAEEFADISKALVRLPWMKGRGVGIITMTGGGGILATEACARHNLDLAKLSPESVEKLAALAPSWQDFENPADIWPPSMITGKPLPAMIRNTLEIYLADDNVHGVMVVMPFFPAQYAHLVFESIELTNKVEKPVVIWLYGTEVEDLVSWIENKGRILYYPTMDQAANVLAKLNDYYVYLNRNND
jgi:acyl-CoA synthetase (NDP forming)